MALVFVCSTFLPRNELQKQLVDEYKIEHKTRLYAKQKRKHGLKVLELTSFIGRSYELALQRVLQDLQKVAPSKGFDVRTFQFVQIPAENDVGLEGFVRTLQIQENVGLLGYSINTCQVSMEEGQNRADWKFLLIFMQ